jgi:hypothetical protein
VTEAEKYTDAILESIVSEVTTIGTIIPGPKGHRYGDPNHVKVPGTIGEIRERMDERIRAAQAEALREAADAIREREPDATLGTLHKLALAAWLRQRADELEAKP